MTVVGRFQLNYSVLFYEVFYRDGSLEHWEVLRWCDVSPSPTTAEWPSVRTRHKHCSGPLPLILPFYPPLLISGRGKIGRIGCNNTKIKACLGLLGGEGDVPVWLLILAARTPMWVRIRLSDGFIE